MRSKPNTLSPSCMRGYERVDEIDQAQGRIFSLGLVLLALGLLLNGVSYVYNYGASHANVLVAQALQLVYGILAVVGLLIMTGADLDINAYLRRNQCRVILFSLVWVISFGIQACTLPQPIGQSSWLPALPFLALLFKYTSIVTMQPGYPLFTELVLAGLVLNFVDFTIFAFDNGFAPSTSGQLGIRKWILSVSALLNTGFVFSVMCYHSPRRSADSMDAATTASLQFKLTIYAYLFSYGLANAVLTAVYLSVPGPPMNTEERAYFGLQWAFSVVNLVPSILFFVWKHEIMRALGLNWLARRSMHEKDRHALWEGHIFSLGFLLFGFSFILTGVAQWVPFGSLPWAACYVMFSVSSVVGLMTMTVAKVDVNAYVHAQPCTVRVAACLWITGNAIQAFLPGIRTLPLVVLWLPCVPLGYVIVQYDRVIRQQLFTFLFIAALVLQFVLNLPGAAALPKWVGIITAVSNCLAMAFVFTVAYWFSSFRRSDQTHTLQLKMTTFAFLFSYGVQNSMFVLAASSNALGTPPMLTSNSMLPLFWLYNAIHIIPPLVTFTCRTPMLKFLGLSWLSRRINEGLSAEMELPTLILAERGDLVEVEEAITRQADLNAYILRHFDDEYTLLHLAVKNNHLDALQRMLNTGAVEVNKPTGRRGKSALFMAAELNRLHAATMLLEHHADANAISDEGQSALIQASAKGHEEIVTLLERHGASRSFRWMGLNAEDVRRADSNSDRGIQASGIRKPTERPVLQGQPRYESVISDMQDSRLTTGNAFDLASIEAGGCATSARPSAASAVELEGAASEMETVNEKERPVYLHFQSSLKKKESPTGKRGNSLFADMHDDSYAALDMRHYWFIEWLEVVRTCREEGGCIIVFDLGRGAESHFKDAAMRTSPNCVMEIGLLYQVFLLDGYSRRMTLVVLTDEDMASDVPIEDLLEAKGEDHGAQRELFKQAYDSCIEDLASTTTTNLLQQWIHDFERAGGDATMFKEATQLLTFDLSVSQSSMATSQSSAATDTCTVSVDTSASTSLATQTLSTSVSIGRSFRELVAEIEKPDFVAAEKSWGDMVDLHKGNKDTAQLQQVLEASQSEIKRLCRESSIVVSSFRKAYPNARHEALCAVEPVLEGLGFLQ